MKPAEWRHNTHIKWGQYGLRELLMPSERITEINRYGRGKPLWFAPITPIAKEKMKGTMGSYCACSDYTSINPSLYNGWFYKFYKTAHDCYSASLTVQSYRLGSSVDKTHPDYYLERQRYRYFFSQWRRYYVNWIMVIRIAKGNDRYNEVLGKWMWYWWSRLRSCCLGRSGFLARGKTSAECGENPVLVGRVWRVRKPWIWKGVWCKLFVEMDAQNPGVFIRKQPLSELIDLLKQYSAIGDSSDANWFYYQPWWE